MHEVVIKYKNRKTLKALTALGEYLGFTLLIPKERKRSLPYQWYPCRKQGSED